MRWAGSSVFVAHALEGEAVGLEPIGERLWRMWFHAYEVGLFEEAKLRVRWPPAPPAESP